MDLATFSYELPESAIAYQPAPERGQSRLLHLRRSDGQIAHHNFSAIIDLLNPGDCLVLNNTKVIPARFWAQKASGGKLELLFERLESTTQALVQIKASKAPKPGSEIILADDTRLSVLSKTDGFYQVIAPEGFDWFAHLDANGVMPLPPYIKRPSDAEDSERYQTVFAEQQGAVAAPTAGLHFSNELLAQLAAKGVQIVKLTLHVGAGTFSPVRSQNILEHQMHYERYELSAEAAATINKLKAAGGRVVAVGTTSVRTLESIMAKYGQLRAASDETNLFIYPGYEYQIIDALITNFHLPESTLLMLVSAFASVEQIKQAYAAALAQDYKFFSYGDAMFIE